MAEARQYPKSQAQHPKADILLVTVTEVEAKAVLCAFPKCEPCCIDDKTYYDLGIVGEARVFMVQSEMGTGGPGGSLFTVSDGIRALSPMVVIMVGIAFGVGSAEQSIGDILVSTQIRDLNPQRIGTSNTDQADIRLRGDRASASIGLLNRFKAGSKDWSVTKVHFGLILSEEKLIDHLGYRNQLLQLEPEAIGGEMEGAGLCAASQRYKVDWILVKAICDWTDGSKGQHKYQQQAAENAARFTLHVIERGGLSRNTSEPEVPEPGTLLCSYDIHSSWVIAIAWEPHGNRIASAGGDGTVHVWHTDTGQHLLTYRGHARTGFLSKTNLLPIVYAVAWSPTDQCIASSGNGKTVYIWNADTGGTNFIYKGHSGLLPNVYALAWSPDGSCLASACSSTGIDKTIHVWNAKTGQIILRYDTHPGLTPNFSVLAAAWSPDGTRIASTCGDRTIRVWSAA
jgi:nucleoside phosphorylase